MLINRYQTVYLSFISTDLPVWNVIEASASLYQRDRDRFHLLLDRQNLPHSVSDRHKLNRGLFWLEISPYRVILTMQSNNKLSYRHFWEKGIYGVSRYCLNNSPERPSESLRLRNFTRHLKVKQDTYPQSVRIEYEMWSGKLKLGTYILHLDIDN